jgi:hypothetical protein
MANTQLQASASFPIEVASSLERPGHFDWEALADADAEYHEWLEARKDEAVASIDLSVAPANDIFYTAA